LSTLRHSYVILIDVPVPSPHGFMRGFDSPDGFIPWCRRLSRETDVGTTILVSFFRHLVSNIKTFMILSDEKQRISIAPTTMMRYDDILFLFGLGFWQALRCKGGPCALAAHMRCICETDEPAARC